MGTRRILVVGATGFIGLHVVDALLAAGYSVRATRRPRSVTLLLRKRDVELVPASLEDPAALALAMKDCDAVCFCAAHYPRYSLDPEAAIRTASDGARAIVEAALEAGMPRVVVTGSIASIGPAPEDRPSDERDVHAEPPADSVYGQVKWHIERELDRGRARGLTIVSLMAGACFGPGDLRLGTNGILAAMLAGALPWWVDGRVNVTDVRDIARAHVAALEHPAPLPHYALPGRTVGVQALFRWLALRYSVKAPALELSAEEATERADREERLAAPKRERVLWPRELVDLVTHGLRVSGSAARRDLGFEPSPIGDTFDQAAIWIVTNVLAPARRREERRAQ
jgi:dihydroflavonol-4-reductase